MADEPTSASIPVSIRTASEIDSLPVMTGARDSEGSLLLFLPGVGMQAGISRGHELYDAVSRARRTGGRFISVPTDVTGGDHAIGSLVQVEQMGVVDPENGIFGVQLRTIGRVNVDVTDVGNGLEGVWEYRESTAGPDLAERAAAARELINKAPIPGQAKANFKRLRDDAEFADQFTQFALDGSLDDDAKIAALTEDDSAKRLAIGLGAFNDKVQELAGDNPAEAIRAKLKDAPLPAELRVKVDRELKSLEKMPPAHPERRGVEDWLNLVADLPWGKRATAPQKTLAEARAVLDSQHAGMDDVKQRIIRQIAQLKRRGERFANMTEQERSEARTRQQYLLLVGPKGTGKTSIMESIAEAMGRQLRLVDIGSLSTAGELNGFARTYVGSKAGKIIGELAAAGTKDIVLGLDEIDKLKSGGMNGDPYSVLLTITDPSRNRSYTDLFADFPFDLSDVAIIATANDLGQIPETLLDRFSLVELRGYSPHEKLDAVRTHIIGRVYRDAETSPDRVQITDAAIERIIDEHTYESGMRGLTDNLTTCFLEAELQVLMAREQGETVQMPIVIDPAFVDRALPHGVKKESPALSGPPGYGTWMFVNSGRGMGGLGAGEVLMYSSGNGKLILTGSVQDGIKESAQAALGWVQDHRAELGVDRKFQFDRHDYQINYGDIGTPKDGPSAGAMTTMMLVSKVTNTPLKEGLTMTGTIEPGGRIGKIGGVVEKVLGAHRAGVTHVLVPEENAEDIKDIPQDVRDAVRIDTVSHLEQALGYCFPGKQFKFPARVVPLRPAAQAQPGSAAAEIGAA